MAIEEVGKITYLTNNVIKWDIPSFSMLSRKDGARIWSPSFGYYGENRRCPLVVLGYSLDTPTDFLGLIFCSMDERSTPVKSVRFGIADETNTEISCSDGEWINPNFFNNGYFSIPKLVHIEIAKRGSNRRISNRKNYCRFFCEIIPQILNATTQTDEIQCVGVNALTKDTDENRLSADNNNSYEICCKDFKNLEKLSENFKNLFLESKNTDLTIKVQDREFNVHKTILTARSSVFDAMLFHELSESNTGVVPIDDCEPEIFEEFLFFLYTGRTNNLFSENVCKLYYVADKYDLPELKEECIYFLKKSLTAENICDVICLSTKHNEIDLLHHAILFLARNMEEILLTANWQVFLKENPIEANELTVKALKLGFTKRNF